MADEGESPPMTSSESLSSPVSSRSPRSHSRSYSSRSRSRSSSYHRRSRSPSYERERYRYYSRSRSRTPRRKRSSRSRSRSATPKEHGSSRAYRGGGTKYYAYNSRKNCFIRNHSHSPMSARRRHLGNRDNPPTSKCLGVFGLSLYTQEKDLKEVFSKYGNVEDARIVCDAQTGKSRGFAFVYFDNSEDARVARERCTGIEIDGRRIRVDFSITDRPHTPTPGIYMGKPAYSRYEPSTSESHKHSPSPYYSKGRYSRSRSRSYSPRKYDYRKY